MNLRLNLNLKILHIALGNEWRGGEQQLFYLLLELKRLRLGSNVLFCRKESPLEEKIDEIIPCFSYSNTITINPFFLTHLYKTIKQTGIELIHCHDARSHSVAVLLVLIFGLKIPIIAARRVDFPIKEKWFSQKKYNHPQVKRIICVSNAIGEIIKPAIANTDKIVTVYDGIDVNRFLPNEHKLRTEYDILPEKKIIGTVGAIVGHKDHRTFVETADRILQKRKDVHFFIIGDGPRKEEILSLISKKGIQEHITLTGFRTDIASVLPELDVFLFTSSEEGLGTSVLDAMAAGVPIVTTNAGGIPEIVKNQYNGLIAEVKDSNSLADKCLYLIDNKNEGVNLVQNGKEQIVKFSKETMARETFKVYKSVLDM